MNAAAPQQGNDTPEDPFIPDFSEGAETGLYLALLELLDEGLLITGDERILEANSAACRMLGRDYRQIAGKPLADLFPSERDFLDARARLFIQGEMRGSLRVALPDGRHRDLRYVAAARIRPGIHALILSPDTLLEGHVQETLGDDARPADALWPRLAAALEQPVIVIDDAGRVAATNAAALAALGFTRDSIVGRMLDACLTVVWPGVDAPPIARITIPGGNEIAARVLPGPKPDWRLLVLPPAARRADDAEASRGGRPGAGPGTPPDDAFAAMFADSPLPTLLCEGRDLAIFAANDAAARVYGYARETLATMRLGDLRATPAGARSCLTQSGIWQQRRHDGGVFDVDILAYPLRSASHPEAMVVMHDLPEAPRLAFETRLRKAVDLDQLDVHFQPLVDAHSGIVRAGEALLRWHHPQLGLIPFQRFAGVARDAGQLMRMGDWVLHAACGQAAGWPAETRVTVNIALEQLTHGELAERVRHALAASGLDGARLELDLDERVLGEESARVTSALAAIAEMGVRLAIDDFGRGVASIPRLRRFPVRALKLDPMLVHEVGVREDSDAVVEAIARMAEVLGIEVLARGVQSDAQQAFLLALGCSLQQGPLFGQPMPAEAFRAHLAAHGSAQ